MKKIISVILCSALVTAILVTMKIGLTPILMQDANYGSSNLKKTGAVDTLFVGSSMFRQGIATHHLSNGNDTYLLAFNGNQPFAITLLIQELINDGVQIDNLYVDMYAYSFTPEPKLSDERIVQGESLDFILSVYRQMQQSGTAGIKELYNMVVKLNNEIFFTWPISYPIINSRYAKGASTTTNSGATAESLQKLSLKFGNEEPNPCQKESLQQLISLCKENSINLVFLETPKYTYLYESDVYCSIMEQYIEFLDMYDCTQILSNKTADECGIEADSAHIIYDFDSDNPAYFTDLLHTSSDGRACLSEILKPILTQ